MKTTLLNYASELFKIVYPIVCSGCGNAIQGSDAPICTSCIVSLPLTNYWHIRNNKIEQHIQGRFPFEYALALCYFSTDSTIQALLHELKYKGRTEVGEYLGNMIGSKLATSALSMPDMIIPLPLHWKKEQKRGYNQSYFFAKGISEILGIPIETKVVARIKESETQTQKNRFERIENVEGIFQLMQPERIKGKHILLVDDVITTGATIEACATALLATDVQISIATIAVAE